MHASHATHRHGRHHRHGAGGGKAVVVLIALVAAAAAVPFGSASEWARAAVAIAGLAVLVIHLLRPPTPRGDTPPDSPVHGVRVRTGASRWLLLSLAVWIATQFLPVPQWAAEVPWFASPGRGIGDAATPARISLAVVNPASALSTLTLWIAYLGLAWAASNRFGSRANARLLLALLAGTGVAQAMAGFLRFNPPWLSQYPFAESRFIGTFSSGNSFGGFLSLTLFATVGLACQAAERLLPLARNTKLRVLLLSNEHARPVVLAGLLALAASVQMAALVLSGSRGAILSALVSLVGLAAWFIRSIARSQHRTRIAWVAAIPLLMVLLCAAGAGYSLTLSRFRQVAESPGDSAGARFALWRATIDLVVARPLGVGPGGYPDAFAAFHPPGFKDARAEHAHNDYLELLAELGVPGFALLLALLLLYGKAVLRAISADARSHDPNRWLYRAACAAVLASALHAIVEFNLTARPGVAIGFFVMAGVAVAPAARSRRGGAAGSPGPTGLLAAVALLLFASAWGIPVVRSSLRQAPACDALGFERDEYFWLPATKPHPAQAVQTLNEAADISPETGRSHYLAAVGAVREFAARKESAIASNAAVYASVDRAGIAQAVGAATREEELLTLRAAVGKLGLGAPAAPLNVDIASAHFRYTARMALLTGDLPIAETTALRVDRILRMAPHDLLTAERCMAGLLDIGMLLQAKVPPDSTATTRAVELGLRCLAMVPGQADRVLVPWADARIAPGIVVERASDQPVEVLWPLYRYCRTMADPRSAHACLALIERACALPASGLPQAGSVGAVAPAIPPSSARARNPPRGGVDTAWNCLARVVRERCRMSLEAGDWLQYRALAAQRTASWAQAADRDDAAARSDDADYLRLRSRRHHAGLTPFQKARLYRHLLNRNLVEEADELLTEMALDASPESLEPLRDLVALKTDAARQHGRILAQARMKRSEGDTRECLRLLDTLSADTPAKWFTHRIHLFRAQCLGEMGISGDSREAASEALRMCPSDPDAVRMALRMLHGNTPPPHAGWKRILELLTDSVPPLGIGTRYMGGKVVLDGVSVAQDGQSASWPRWASVRCTAHWRFFGPVPADLAVDVTILDSNRQTVRSSRFALGKTHGDAFAGGYPAYGCAIRTAIVVPAAALQGGALALSMVRPSLGRTIPDEEGLDRVSIAIRPDSVARAWPVGTNAPPIRMSFAASPASLDLAAAITNAWSLSGLPQGHADTRSNAATAGVPVVIGFVLSPTDDASGINLADCHPDTFLLASRGNGIDVISPSPCGLGRGLARVCETIAGAFLPLPDDRFAPPPGERSGSIPPLWALDAPAISWRFMSNLSNDTGSERFLGHGTGPGPNRSPGQPLGSAWRSARGLSDEAMGRRFSHNMVAIFAPSSHWKSHPEWFPQADGHRPCPTNDDWQVCLSASGVVARAVEAASDFFRANPDRPMYSIGINDSQNWCECGACAALCPAEERSRPARDRWWSEPYWRFANKVACGLEPSWPTKKLGAIAYAAVSPPPSFPLHSNLVVFVCEDAAALFDPAYSRDSERELGEWTSKARRVGRYGYAGLTSWVFPRYCRDQLALDIRRCSAAGVRKFYIEDAWLPWVDGPLPYITAELLWDPWRDPRELQRRFCAASFGAAASTMDTYFEALQQAWTNAPQGRWFDGLFDFGAQAGRYPPETRKRLTSLLNTARQTPGLTECDLARIAAVADPLRFSNAVAREQDALTALSRPPSNEAELLAARKSLKSLHLATAERRAILAAATNEWWHTSLLRTVRSGDTLGKWDTRVEAASACVSNLVAAIEAACKAP